MKINWKIRIKNPVFWMTFIPAMLTFIYTALGLFGVVPGVSQEMAVKLASMIISVLVTLGVLVDPTTSGVSDSARAMGYKDIQEDEVSLDG